MNFKHKASQNWLKFRQGKMAAKKSERWWKICNIAAFFVSKVLYLCLTYTFSISFMMKTMKTMLKVKEFFSASIMAWRESQKYKVSNEEGNNNTEMTKIKKTDKPALLIVVYIYSHCREEKKNIAWLTDLTYVWISFSFSSLSIAHKTGCLW